MKTRVSSLREELLREGYCVIPGVLDSSAIKKARRLCRTVLKVQESEEYREDHRSIGSLVNIWSEPGLIDYIAHPRTLEAFRMLGFDDPRYYYGMVFNKLPRTPQTFWHQDGDNWAHPAFYGEIPLDVILLYYLDDTRIENGCLRVIPGSQRKRHALHDLLRGSYTPDLRRMADPGAPAFRAFDDEAPVPVKAGDLVFMDARLLHAAHANKTSVERTALSLWYHPDYRGLPEEIKARVRAPEAGTEHPFLPKDWPAEAKAKLLPMLPPVYRGSAQALKDCNIPGKALR